jgi:hypothetical protein
MKVNIEIDCTPDEARRFLGLPDVTPLNELYIENVRNAMSGATSLEQLQELSKQFAPMGQMGLKLFQNFREGGAAFAEGAGGKRGG